MARDLWARDAGRAPVKAARDGGSESKSVDL